jgi:RNA polymerase sigma-70 factor (ECF subfamily)
MSRSRKIRVAALSPSIADEADFVRRVKAFQEDAWDELYHAYFPKMYRYLYVHVGNRDVAEELAAEVFEQACKGIHRYRYRGVPLSSWLYRVAHNVMVDWKRKFRRNPEVPVLGDMPGADDAERIEVRDELARAMSDLTREQRQVLVLRHIEGHSSASAGEIMGKKENAIRALEFRALASLRRAMSKNERKGEAS